MKTPENLMKSILLLGVLFLTQILFAQKLTLQNSNIKIDGTSTLHDWTMTSTQGSFSGNLSGNAINDVKFVLKSTSIKSKESAMDKNAYKSLQTSKYPEITFTAPSIIVGSSTLSGNLTVAGTTRGVKIPVTVTKSGDAYVIKGNTRIKMSAFGITPPSFMMGTIKTGDDITITFNVTTTAN